MRQIIRLSFRTQISRDNFFLAATHIKSRLSEISRKGLYACSRARDVKKSQEFVALLHVNRCFDNKLVEAGIYISS